MGNTLDVAGEDLCAGDEVWIVDNYTDTSSIMFTVAKTDCPVAEYMLFYGVREFNIPDEQIIIQDTTGYYHIIDMGHRFQVVRSGQTEPFNQ